jgi:heat shock protein HslJ
MERFVAPRMVGASLALAIACTEARRPVADPEAEFRAQLGREWALVRLGSYEIPPPPPGTPPDLPGRDLVPGRRPTIRFAADPPGVGGRTFCNGYGSPYELRGDSLRLTRIESSAVGCDGPDSLETRFFRALWGTRRFELDSTDTRLVLVAEDGTQLTFVPAAARATTAADSLPIRRLEASNAAIYRYSSGIRDSTCTTIRDAAGWEEMWRRLTANHGPPRPPPPIDFQKEMALVATLGAQRSGGYAIIIESVIDRDGYLDVHVSRRAPGRSCGVIGMVTAPADVAIVPRREVEVRVLAHDVVTDCSAR